MALLFPHLDAKAQRGSKPRCHLLTHGSRKDVAARLTRLATPFATVSESDAWMPDGFSDVEEAELHRAARLISVDHCETLTDWWLAPASRRGKTPNFDIAATCRVEGRRGLLLVEAKAHANELSKEALGRILKADSSLERKLSHTKIGAAIEEARAGLERATSLSWKIGRDSHYQMSNRFAWAWKMTQLGIPVVLVYLGFINAAEMEDRGGLFSDHSEWESSVKAHSESLFSETVWGRAWDIGGEILVPLICSLEQPLTGLSGNAARIDGHG